MNKRFIRALNKAINAEGSQTALANRLGCSPATVSNWLHERSRPEAFLAIMLEGVDIPRHVSRPDLWPNRKSKKGESE